MAIRSTLANPKSEPTGGCHHIWVVADGGNIMTRRRRCYTKGGANGERQAWATRNYNGGDRPGNLPADPKLIKAMTSVRQCLPGCPCGHNPA